jgi:hypothetical protein
MRNFCRFFGFHQLNINHWIWICTLRSWRNVFLIFLWKESFFSFVSSSFFLVLNWITIDFERQTNSCDYWAFSDRLGHFRDYIEAKRLNGVKLARERAHRDITTHYVLSTLISILLITLSVSRFNLYPRFVVINDQTFIFLVFFRLVIDELYVSVFARLIVERSIFLHNKKLYTHPLSLSSPRENENWYVCLDKSVSINVRLDACSEPETRATLVYQKSWADCNKSHSRLLFLPSLWLYAKEIIFVFLSSYRDFETC